MGLNIQYGISRKIGKQKEMVIYLVFLTSYAVVILFAVVQRSYLSSMTSTIADTITGTILAAITMEELDLIVFPLGT